MNKEEPPENVRSMDITTHPDLSAQEKETSLNISNDGEEAIIYSDISTMIKWILSIKESEIEWINTYEGDICGCKARVPKGIIRLQSSPRGSNRHSRMVSYGDEL